MKTVKIPEIKYNPRLQSYEVFLDGNKIAEWTEGYLKDMKPVIPSSKCQQISLILGELYNDIITIDPAMKVPSNSKMILAQLSEYAKHLNSLFEETEKACYDKGWEDALGYAMKQVEKEISNIPPPLPPPPPPEEGMDALKDMEV